MQGFFDSETEDFDFQGACEYLREIRSLSANKIEKEYCSFVAEVFNKTLIKETRTINDNVKYNHKYKLPRGEEVCRKVFLMAYGFSKDDFDNCSSLRKLSGNGRIAYEKNFTSYTDAYLPDMTYFEVANMFLSNTHETGNISM